MMIFAAFASFVPLLKEPWRERFDKVRKSVFFGVSECWKCTFSIGMIKMCENWPKWERDLPKSTLADTMQLEFATFAGWFVRTNRKKCDFFIVRVLEMNIFARNGRYRSPNDERTIVLGKSTPADSMGPELGRFVRMWRTQVFIFIHFGSNILRKSIM